MPAVQPREIVDAILNAIDEGGWTGLLISAIRRHPREFAVTGPGGESLKLWVYCWTLTPGGRPQLENEYRIQITGVEPPLALNPEGPTILIGYHPDEMFSGFDIRRHRRFGGSPSVQIDIRVVRQALQDGMAFDRKDNDEIAIGIRPDQLMSYINNAERLHSEGARSRIFSLLERAAALPRLSAAESSQLDQELERLARPRREIVQEVRRLARQANFRQQVLHAYGHRCAVTRMQLRLIEAAHILPVGAPGSIDHVRNGLSLSPTYHRAFDNGLIYLDYVDESFVMKVNPNRVASLTADNRIHGLESFKEPLGPIYLPPDKSQWPSQTLVRRANEFRRVDLT